MRVMPQKLKTVLIAGIFLSAATPLIVTQSLYFPYVAGKVFYFRILIEILTIPWLIYIARNPEYRPRLSWFNVSFFLLVIIALIASITGVDVSESLWGNFERMDGWITLLHIWVFFVITSSLFKTRELWERYIKTSVVVSALISGAGILQALGIISLSSPDKRIDAFFGNPIFLSTYLLFHVFFIVFLLIKKNMPVSVRSGYVAILILELGALFLTATRGASLGLLAGMLTGTCLLLFIDRKTKIVRIASGILIFLAIIGTGAIIISKDSSFVRKVPVISRLSNLSLDNLAKEQRLYIWQAAWEGFKEKPFLGWGLGHFDVVYDKYFKPGIYSRFMNAVGESHVDKAHNVILDWLITSGIMGILAYISLYITAIRSIWSSSLTSYERITITGLLVAYFINNLFSFDTLVSLMFFAFVAAFIQQNDKENHIKKEFVLLPSRIFSKAIVCGIIILFPIIYYINFKDMSTASKLANLLKKPEEQATGKISQSLTALADYSHHKEDVYFLNAKITGDLIERKEKSDPYLSSLFLSSRDGLTAYLTDKPYNTLVRQEYIKMLRIAGDFEGALSEARFAQKISPRKQDPVIEEGLTYQSMKRHEDAMTVFKKALDMEPEYDVARIRYAVSAIYAGRIDEAKMIMKKRYEKPYVADIDLLNAYIYTGNYLETIPIFEELLEDHPQQLAFRFPLAALYVEYGKKDKAILLLEAGKTTNPERLAAIEGLIEDMLKGKRPLFPSQ